MTLIYNFSHLGFCMSMDILRSTPHPRYLQNISYKASIVTIAEVNRFRFWANPQIWLSICYAAAKLIQSCPTLCDPIDGSPPGLPVLWDSPGKNTGVGFHFLLQCMKVKNETEAAQSCPTLNDSMDCSPQGSSVHGIFQARVLKWSAIAFFACEAWHHFFKKSIDCFPFQDFH